MAVSHFFLFCLPRFLCFLVFSSVSSLFPFISSFYLPPHLCLYSLSLPVLLSITFLLSFHLVSFESLSSSLASYIYVIISLRLSLHIPLCFCFSQYCMYSTISPEFLLLHHFFIRFVFHTFSFCSPNSSTLYLSVFFPACVYISALF
jgi:hypothetical protein